MPSSGGTLCMQRFCVSIPPAEAYSLTTDGYGIFKLRTNLGVRCTHNGGGGGEVGGFGLSSTRKSAQELTRRDRKTYPHLSPPERSNPDSSDLIRSLTRSDTDAMSPRQTDQYLMIFNAQIKPFCTQIYTTVTAVHWNSSPEWLHPSSLRINRLWVWVLCYSELPTLHKT